MGQTQYTWDIQTDNLIFALDEGGPFRESCTTVPVRHGKLVAINDGASSFYYHYDVVGSVRQVISGQSTVTATFTYSAFGSMVESTGASDASFRFLGEMQYLTDNTTGLLCVRRRSYSPLLSRWLTEDVIDENTGESPYEYASNSPLNNVDPSGMLSESLLGSEVLPCGGFAFLFGWDLDLPAEGDGRIFQWVDRTICVEPCFDNEKIGICPITAFDFAEDEFAKQMRVQLWNRGDKCIVSEDAFCTRYRYVEQWRVYRGGKKWSDDISQDIFMNFGYTVPTSGADEVVGHSVFVPEELAGQEPINSYVRKFRKGPKGVPMAGQLRSICLSEVPEFRAVLDTVFAINSIVPIEGGGRTSRKSVDHKWNCCCNNASRFRTTNYEIEGKGGDVIHLDGADRPKLTDC